MSSISSASSSNHLNGLELQRFSTDMIQRSPRRRHDDIDLRLERMELRTDSRPPDRQHGDLFSLRVTASPTCMANSGRHQDEHRGTAPRWWAMR
jgi:hypothetical protein